MASPVLSNTPQDLHATAVGKVLSRAPVSVLPTYAVRRPVFVFAVVFFVSLLPGNTLGIQLAAIFAIFTNGA
jgi:ABC-type anion transport system duplicated permease subunit